MRMMDFSSWQGILTTLIGLTLITVIGVGLRLVIMMRVQERRQRANRHDAAQSLASGLAPYQPKADWCLMALAVR